MTGLMVLYQFARADFLERIRRYSFLVTLAATLVAAYLSVPPPESKLVTVALDNIRGIYNSAWVGAMLSIMCSCFLSAIGFYLVKNALERDKKTRVGQILRSSPISSVTYLLGKAISNFLLLGTLVFVVMVTAVLMQFVRGEDTVVHLVPLIMPFLVSTLPFMAVIAALAVLFESLPVLRGSWGNVIYFFFWIFVILASIDMTLGKDHKIVTATNDLAGMTVPLHSMTEQVSAEFPDYKGELQIGAALQDSVTALQTFVWKGVDWTLGIAVARLWWLFAAFGIVVLASLGFRRFQEEDSGQGRSSNAADEPADANGKRQRFDFLRMLLRDWSPRSSFIGLVLGELRLMFSSAGRGWYLVALALVIAQLAAPLNVGRQFLLPAAWIWPIALWSAMGCRERLFGTDQVVFSAPNMIQRQVSAIWIAGIAVTAFTGLGIGLRFAVAGDLGGLASWGTGVLFIPSLALLAGVITGGRKLFEVVYLFLWYIGPLNHVPQLDFMGAYPETAALSIPVYFLAAALLFMIVSQAWRVRQART